MRSEKRHFLKNDVPAPTVSALATITATLCFLLFASATVFSNLSRRLENDEQEHVVPQGVKIVETRAFSSCPSIKKVVVSEGVEEFRYNAFEGCASITTIVVPKSVAKIGENAFTNCPSLTSINVAEDNPAYRTVDGVLFSKDGKNLIKYPGAKQNKSYVVPEGVQRIAQGAFENCPSLTTIVLPKGVLGFGDRAFLKCRALKSINLPESVHTIGPRTFYECSSLTSIKLPEGVRRIGYEAFYGCSSLTSFVIPENVVNIENNAFETGSSLTSIDVAKDILKYCSVDGVLFTKDMSTLVKRPAGKIEENYVVPESVVNIETSAFAGCSSLKSIVLPDGATSIGRGAFAGCSSLKSINIPKGVKNIEESTFSRCSSLTTIVIPEGVETIGIRAFWDCLSLSSVVLPKSLKTLEENSFERCVSLTSVQIPEAVRADGPRPQTSKEPVRHGIEYAFVDCSALQAIDVDENNPYYRSVDGVVYSKDGTLLIKYPTGKKDDRYVVPEGVRFISSRAFQNCVSLKSIDISEGVANIDSRAFFKCASLSSINFPQSLVWLGTESFYDCPSLKSVKIPKGVQDGYYPPNPNTTSRRYHTALSRAFALCNALQAIDVDKDSPYYSSVDGVVYSKDGTLLVKYPTGKKDDRYVVPKGVQIVDENAFDDCVLLKSIDVEKGSSHYRSVDGVLFSKNGTTLVKCPAGGKRKSYVVPDGVEEIRKGAFAGCSELKTLVIPESATKLPPFQDFKTCDALTIRAPKGSCAEEYAKERKKRFKAIK